MVIEILKQEDLKSYKELIDECFGTSNDLEKYQKYNENQAYKIFVVKEEDMIIGSATQYTVDLFTFDFQPCLMLFNVAVKSDYRAAHKLYESVGFKKASSIKYSLVL